MAVRIPYAELDKFTASVQQSMSGKSPHPAWAACWKRWAWYYRTFAKERFYRFSRGGGDWAPLKASTIRKRRNYTKPQRAYRSKLRTAQAAQLRLGKASAANSKRATSASVKRLQKARERYAATSAKVQAAKQKVSEGIASIAILIDTAIMVGGLNPAFTPASGALEQFIDGGIRVGYGGPVGHKGRDGKVKATIAQIAEWHQSGTPNMPARKHIVPPDDPTKEKFTKEGQRALAAVWRDATGGAASAG